MTEENQYLIWILYFGMGCFCLLISFATYYGIKGLRSLANTLTFIEKEIKEQRLEPFKPSVAVQPVIIEKQVKPEIKKKPEPVQKAPGLPAIICGSCSSKITSTPIRSKLTDKGVMLVYKCDSCGKEVAKTSKAVV